MKNRKLLMTMLLLASIICCLGCGKTKQSSNTTSSAESATSVNEETTLADSETETTEEKLHLTYEEGAVLTEENLEDVVFTFFTIKSEDELQNLVGLPLTENYFNECVENFPYLENINEMEQWKMMEWGINEEGKLMCIIAFTPVEGQILYEYNPHDIYYVVMTLKDHQIDSMDVKLVFRKSPL